RHDVAWVGEFALGAAYAFVDIAHVGIEHGPRRLQQGRVDVALHGDVVADDADRLIHRHPPVDADRVDDAAQPHVVEERPGTDAEVDAGHTDAVERGVRVRGDVRAVVRATEGARPRVEELHDGGTGVALDLEETTRDA